MNIVTLVEYLVKSIVKDPEMVSVKEFDGEEYVITIQVLVSEDQMGTLIGKAGATANAIRTIAQTSAYINGLKKVRIDFDSF